MRGAGEEGAMSQGYNERADTSTSTKKWFYSKCKPKRDVHTSRRQRGMSLMRGERGFVGAGCQKQRSTPTLCFLRLADLTISRPSTRCESTQNVEIRFLRCVGIIRRFRDAADRPWRGTRGKPTAFRGCAWHSTGVMQRRPTRALQRSSSAPIPR